MGCVFRNIIVYAHWFLANMDPVDVWVCGIRNFLYNINLVGNILLKLYDPNFKGNNGNPGSLGSGS